MLDYCFIGLLCAAHADSISFCQHHFAFFRLCIVITPCFLHTKTCRVLSATSFCNTRERGCNGGRAYDIGGGNGAEIRIEGTHLCGQKLCGQKLCGQNLCGQKLCGQSPHLCGRSFVDKSAQNKLI